MFTLECLSNLDISSNAMIFKQTTFIHSFTLSPVRDSVAIYDTLGCIMFGPFWSVWCKIALAEVGVSLP